MDTISPDVRRAMGEADMWGPAAMPAVYDDDCTDTAEWLAAQEAPAAVARRRLVSA